MLGYVLIKNVETFVNLTELRGNGGNNEARILRRMIRVRVGEAEVSKRLRHYYLLLL